MRGRPRKESSDADVERRRRNARIAQSRMKDRKSLELSEMKAEIEALQNIIEELGKSFDSFSSTLLNSSVLKRDNDLVMSLQHTLGIFTSLSGKAHQTRHVGSEEISVEQLRWEPESQNSPQIVFSSDPAYENNLMQPVVHRHALTSTPAARAPVPPAIVSLMPIENPILSNDHWFIEILSNVNVPFSERLFRSALLESYKYLRERQRRLGGRSESPQNQHSSRPHRYSFQVSNPEAMLRLNSMTVQNVVRQDQGRNHRSNDNEAATNGNNDTGSKLASSVKYHQSNNESDQRYINNLGVQLRNVMMASGVNIGDFINADEVETCLRQKGMVHYDHHQIYMQINTDIRSKGDGSSQVVRPPKATQLKVDIQSFMQQLTALSFCLGNGVGFPESAITPCLIASVVEVV